MQKLNKFFVMAFCFATLTACDNQTTTTENTAETDATGTTATETTARPTAVATISPASGSNVSGTVTFTEQDNGQIHLVAELQNLTPGNHAIHLHQNGDCSAPDATSAGPHWNPTNNPHGRRNGGQGDFHKGDLPNLEVNQDGTARMELDVEGWSIGGDSTTNIVNRAVIIHADPDDYTSQPAGNAGKRIGCGVISMQQAQ